MGAGLEPLSMQARLAKRAERIVALAKDWLGPLSGRQDQEIVRLAKDFPDICRPGMSISCSGISN